MNQMMMTKTLSSINITPKFALDINEFREELKATSYDFVLLDLSKDDFPILEIYTIIKDQKNLQILAFDNITEKKSIPFKVTYTQEPLNKNEILDITTTITSE